MQRLPRLTSGSHSWRLPLADYSARELTTVLLADDLEARRRRMTDLLRYDPSLVLWIVCRTTRWQEEAPASIPALAGWFADCAAELLQWSEDELPGKSIVARESPKACADLAVKSVAVACCTSRLLNSGQSQAGYVSGLLHAAPQWLDSSGPPATVLEKSPTPRFLPSWLIQLLREIESDRPRSFCARVISQTRASLGQSDPADLDEAIWPEGGTDPRQAAREARIRWQHEQHQASSWLPWLTRKLARLNQLEKQFQRTLETEKLEALKALAYGASHEINNPLANISTRAQTLLRDEHDPERRRKLEVINSQAFRAHEMISDMMLFARPPELQLGPVDLTALVEEVIAEISQDAEEQGTELLRVTPDEPVVVQADRTHLAVALKAVCRNSLEAMAAGGQIQFFVQPCCPTVVEQGEWSEILITDSGPGIPPEVRRHLFDPYFSGREAGRGLGLGLSKCWRIVTEHGGRIDVESEHGRGTTFIIRLPNEACPSIRTAG